MQYFQLVALNQKKPSDLSGPTSDVSPLKVPCVERSVPGLTREQGPQRRVLHVGNTDIIHMYTNEQLDK